MHARYVSIIFALFCYLLTNFTDPSKSKTKCIAFLQQKRNLRNLDLNGKPLPWVESVKHLGTTITNTPGCRLDQDLLEKRALYIAKNNELHQEFYYTHPKTKIWINNIYNTSFYGAPLWDMFSRNFEKLEKTWNVSIRTMLSLPRNTHRYFLEPLSGSSPEQILEICKQHCRRKEECIEACTRNCQE